MLSPLFLSCLPPSSTSPCPGVVSLSQALCSSDEYSNSLLHLDLSKNPGVLSGDDASVRKHIEKKTNSLDLLLFSPKCDIFSFFFPLHSPPRQNLYLFLSQPNCLVHLDLSGTDCSVDSVSVNSPVCVRVVCVCVCVFGCLRVIEELRVWLEEKKTLC